jgi:Asp-tRNA(Asn)/Glu-tRNA(Gln) amidotransferase A subunit family amidase
MTSYDENLCFMTATEAVAAFKARKLSPVDLMNSVIARCEEVNPKINALTTSFFDRALQQAKDAEARYAKSDGQPRPLEGVPVAIKDFHPVKGEITTFGSKIFEHSRPDYTAPTVQRLLDAGAIMHCRSATPEFAYSGVTHSPLWGITRNPWNLAYTPGGSSGGAAAAVAAGLTTIADGTDGGGSIRIPSSACGVIGYKPPFGRNPLDLDHPLESLLHYGPITRCVADAAIMQNVMSGPHLGDMCSLRERMVIPEESDGIKGWKIAFSMNLGYFEVDPEVQRNTHAAVETFKALGCTVREVDLHWNWGTLDAWMTQWEGLFAGIAEQYLPRWRFEMDPVVVKILERGQTHSAARFYRCNLVRGEMYKTLGPILEEHNVLICPTLAIPSVKADHDESNTEFRINGNRVQAYVGWVMTNPFNLVSQCPALSIPSGFADSGIPTGVQIVGKTFDDLSVFRAAAAFEKAKPWRHQRPKLRNVDEGADTLVRSRSPSAVGV